MTDAEKNKKGWDSLSNLEKIKLYEEEAERIAPYFDLVEDSYEYDNGLLFIIYNDKERTYEREHVCFDLDNYEDYLEFKNNL